MTKRLSYTRLSKSRFLGLQHFQTGPKTAPELGRLMWGEHRMALVNAGAVVRELLLMELVAPGAQAVEKHPAYRATPKAGPILKNPSWICKYCSLDTTNSNKRLWAEPCMACPEYHYFCRFCRKHILKATGQFPYTVKVRGCPGTVEIPKRPEKKPKKKIEKPGGEPLEKIGVQGDLFMGDPVVPTT